MADFLETVLSDEEPTAPIEAPIQQPVEPAPVEQPVPLAPAPPKESESKPEPGYVPLSALMDERDRRKAAEATAAQYQQTQQQPSIPDPSDDPDAYNAHIGNVLTTALTEQRFGISSEMAKSAYGEDAVTAAATWAAEKARDDVGFRASWQNTLQTSTHPMDWIVRQHKRDALVSAIGDAPTVDDWFTQEAAKRGYVAQGAPFAAAPAAVQPAPSPVAPPASIAAMAPASAPQAIDGKAEFEAIFNRR